MCIRCLSYFLQDLSAKPKIHSSLRDIERNQKTCFNPIIARVLRENRVLEKVIELTKSEDSVSSVSKLCLDILSTIAQRCHARHLVIK